MPQSSTVNRRIVLNDRPRGAATAEDFRLENTPVPTPAAGQVLLRTLNLSLDPDMRGRRSDGPSSAAPVAVGDVLVGGTVSRIKASRHGDFKVGELVLGYAGWQDYALSDGSGLTSLYREEPHPSRALGVMSLTGFTADMGLLDIGQPVSGETVVVAATNWGLISASITTGPTCPDALQSRARRASTLLRERRRCRVRRRDAAAQCQGARPRVRPHCCVQRHRTPSGSRPVGFAGGHAAAQAHQDAGLHHLRRLRASLWRICPGRRGRGEGRWAMGEWVKANKVKVSEDIVFCLKHAREAFTGLLEGKNFGKLVIQLAHE